MAKFLLEVLHLAQQHMADNKQPMLVLSTVHFILPFCIEPCQVEFLGLTVHARRVPVAECGLNEG